MLPLSASELQAYWSAPEIGTNLLVFLNLLGALLLGMVVGYERSFHGRAAGMRTYGMVCMASAALTVIAGYPQFWYAGVNHLNLSTDPTRVIQGIVTGIGFLGAGVIMKDGTNISGLTTAASLWASSAIGVLVGVGFYVAAILLSLLSVLCMIWISRLESWLPSHPVIAVVLGFSEGFRPDAQHWRAHMRSLGYDMLEDSFTVGLQKGCVEWHFVAVVEHKDRHQALSQLGDAVSHMEGVHSFQLSHARN
jgi:putative Mg2+ transporter-C (MgtC) family protein